jgi:hypothetical protein
MRLFIGGKPKNIYMVQRLKGILANLKMVEMEMLDWKSRQVHATVIPSIYMLISRRC